MEPNEIIGTEEITEIVETAPVKAKSGKVWKIAGGITLAAAVVGFVVYKVGKVIKAKKAKKDEKPADESYDVD